MCVTEKKSIEEEEMRGRRKPHCSFFHAFLVVPPENLPKATRSPHCNLLAFFRIQEGIIRTERATTRSGRDLARGSDENSSSHTNERSAGASQRTWVISVDLFRHNLSRGRASFGPVGYQD
jgi:hypothetical protein